MKYVEMGGPFENGADAKGAAYSMTECIKVMQEIARSSPMADVVFDGHLLQLLGVAISPAMANDEVDRSREVMFDVLIDVALTNISLCQRLVFLLRSFIGVLETQKAECSSESTVIALKLLRYAQRRLSGRMFDKSLNLEEGRQGSVGYPMSHESSSSNSMLQQYTQQQYASLAIPASESATSPLSLESPDGVDSLPILFGVQASLGGSTSNEKLHQDSNPSKKKGRSKKILKLFKKRSQKIPPTSDYPTQPKSPERVPAKTFTFPSVFHKAHSRDTTNEPMSMSRQFENMAWILRQMDNTCSAVEKNLMKSFSQKVADWALWSSSKEDALASVTQSFRSDLRLMNNSNQSSSAVEEERFPILNPLDPSELLTSVDSYECFILPSAHFPLLLCFESQPNTMLPATMRSGRSRNEAICRDVVYRTKVEILGLSGTRAGKAFFVQGCVAGAIKETTASSKSLVFETKSNWGNPKTLSLKVSSSSGPELTPLADDKNQNDVGCAFVDLSPIYRRVHEGYEGAYINAKSRIYTYDSAEEFDQHGEVEYRPRGAVELHLRVSAEILSVGERPQKSLLLYKHGDDLRQELLAIQFIERCNDILKASGLDLKLKTFRCLPVGAQKGFIEWVKGTVPLSELCKTSSSSQSGSNPDSSADSKHRSSANLSDEPQPQRRSWCKYKSLRGLPQKSNGSIIENPIQDFLRSAAFDEAAPYFVKKDVMDTYVKSCAGYCVITYLLGVGDRHLDNILLHQNGHLLHCDYSFILGHDPKTYMPMRITEEMVRGFGGRDSDNFARFLSFTGAAFLTLRRHNNLRTLLSHIRLMVDSNMVDVSLHQPPEEAILAMRGRFRLDLNDDDAMSYIEEVVEKSITSKMWKAVDVIHSIGKNF
jgi:phosphatidylinositol 3-kinase